MWNLESDSKEQPIGTWTVLCDTTPRANEIVQHSAICDHDENKRISPESKMRSLAVSRAKIHDQINIAGRQKEIPNNK